ncbi:DUF2278 family protein [Methylobacterium indicum]|uniref:LTD domain-containing protein n=1 Tax=Methylobacterium indicum TaxID=1775910 RepID=A0ABR5GSX6_9HYPH|nr:DUF2278 family protein [Methylobacterium indicum]KMO12415.1 hypothetical protein QR79_28405 [Methylobacterium indicum]KMO20673.1 hypothetical protein QR78_10270 [Methylobacterium indicum]
MPLKNYSVLKGRPINNRLATGRSPHYQVLVSANGELHRIAINVQSQDGSEVQFLVRSRFEHPITEALAALAEGVSPAPSQPNGIALDYVRGNLMQPWELKPLPLSAAGPDNDLNEKLDAYVQRAMADEESWIYAFGETWGPENDKADRYFGFRPGRGIHDIHMNQGNPPGRFAGDNGPYQDGGLIFWFPREEQWVSVFLKFQTQAWHSDDASANPAVPADPDHGGEPHAPVDRDRIPPRDVPDGLVRIIAALVNDTHTPERETVTLLNTADVPVDLTGWSLKDKQKNAMPLTGTIAAGATLTVAVQAPVALSNKGGIITLLDEKEIKVHGVAYTKEQARQPGRTIPFQA